MSNSHQTEKTTEERHTDEFGSEDNYMSLVHYCRWV